MNLKARREAEEKQQKSRKFFDALLDRFVHVCIENGIMARLLFEIREKSKDKVLNDRITDVLKRGEIYEKN